MGKPDFTKNEAIVEPADFDGHVIVAGLVADTKNKSYEKTSFTAAMSPLTLDFYADFSNAPASKGYITIDGVGDLLVAYDLDGLGFGSNTTLKRGDTINFDGLSIRKLRLTHSGTDTAYRCFVAQY